MSIEINVNDYDVNTRKKILRDLTIIGNENKYTNKTETFKLFELSKTNNNGILIPFNYYHDNLSSKHQNKTRQEYPLTNLTFNGQLNEVQTEILYEATNYLQNNGCILINLYTGCGKTIFSIYLSIMLKLKTLIFVHRLNIIDQWIASIKKVCKGCKIQLLDSKTKIDPLSDFYLINVDVLKHRTRDEFRDIGTVISDESHCICTENRSNNLFLFNPKYLIGLTATPDRTDGLDKILVHFFGNYWIVRKMQRIFNVYILNTCYKPETKTQTSGKLNWNAMINDMCENQPRNDTIIKLCNYFVTRNILVLCKRKNQTNYLHQSYKEQFKVNNDVGVYDGEIYIQSQKKFNLNCRVLFSTYSKSGLGFDFEKLDMLIIASDVNEGITQYLGRVFRKSTTFPIIIDFREAVYKHHPFNKHLESRLEVYEKSGGVTKDFLLNFPDF